MKYLVIIVVTALIFLTACQQTDIQERASMKEATEPPPIFIPAEPMMDEEATEVPGIKAYDNRGTFSEPIVATDSETFLSEDFSDFGGSSHVVQGYSLVKEEPSPWCMDNEACTIYKWVHFTTLKLISEDFNKSEHGWENPLIHQNTLLLGCVGEDGMIWYINDNEKHGTLNGKVTKSLSEAILKSTERYPITLRLDTIINLGGRGAPPCYSPFTRILPAKT